MKLLLRSSAWALGLMVSSIPCAVPALAQVNTEPLRKRVKKTGVSLIVGGTFDGHTGNTQGLTASGLVGAGAATGRHLAFTFATIDYSKLNGALGVDKTFAHVRYNFEIVRGVVWEAFSQAESDVFQRIKIRNLFGSGPRFALFDTDAIGLFCGVTFMLERDVIDVQAGAPDSRTYVLARWSSYLSARTTLSDGIDAVTTTYVQPAVLDWSNARVLSESGFVFKVGKTLATSITFTAHYDSDPPTGVLPTDVELKNTLTLTL